MISRKLAINDELKGLFITSVQAQKRTEKTQMA
jgi:hypothetical protein